MSETAPPNNFCARDPGIIQRCLRLAAACMVRNTSERASRFMLALAKRIRARGRKVERRISLSEVDRQVTPARRSAAAVILTHDLDWKACWERHRTVADWEEEAGVRSVFLYLTGGPYRLDHAVTSDLAKRGFEIGLHGVWHDIALAFRSRGKIIQFLNEGIEGLGRKPAIFRSPALSVSQTLFEALEASGIARDGSIPVVHPHYHSCFHPAPYRYPGQAVTEYPLALQDDYLFRDRGLSDDEALAFAAGLLHLFIEKKGVFILNTHPGIIVHHERFYKGFLTVCRESGVAMALMEGIAVA